MPDLPIRKICLNNSGTVLSSPRKTEAASILNVSAYKKLCLVLVLVVSVQINFVINNFYFLHGLRKDQAEICS